MNTETLFALIGLVLCLTIILSGCAMLFLLLRNTRFGGSTSSVSGTDLTNQMVLFQSMRETVEQQKELARQLNFSIDKKVQDIREIVASVSTIDERISSSENELHALISETKEELQSLNRRIGYIKEQVGLTDEDESAPSTDSAPQEAPEAPVERDSEPHTPENETPAAPQSDTHVAETPPIASVIDEKGKEVPYDGNEPLPPLNAIAVNFNEKRDFVDSWAGVDFGVQQLEEPELSDIPDEPEDPEASRDAFRTLLNMKPGQAGEDFIEQSMTTLERDVEVTPVQRRIYEFSDSGMRIPDIARELGVGKGEVKLILSMRGSQA